MALRRTKIVATLGPSSQRPEVLDAMIAAGMNVARLNFSHGSPEQHIALAALVRERAQLQNKQVGILADLQGPKIRISRFKDGDISLKEGADFILDANLPFDEGDINQVGIDYKALPKDVSAGDTLLLDDGRIVLRVIKVENNKIITTVMFAGVLSNNKGINRQGGGLSAEALTEKDKKDIKTAAAMQADYVAVSFPRCAADIHQARQLLHDAGGHAAL
ncbi:hypothetical protein LCGC14_0685680, partial [marine sediment metagenome]